MRRPTKLALSELAKKMVETGIYLEVRGTVDFIDTALQIHKQSESMVHPNTIMKHVKELEMLCQELTPKVEQKEEKEEWQKIYDSSGYELQEWEAIELISSEVILRKAKEIIEESEVVTTKLQSPIKDYTMFIEDEDGLRVIRGTYKGKYVADIDRENFVGCAAGWSKYQLNLNEQLGADRKGSLTEDDKNVFLDIMSNKYV